MQRMVATNHPLHPISLDSSLLTQAAFQCGRRSPVSAEAEQFIRAEIASLHGLIRALGSENRLRPYVGKTK